MKPKQVKKLLLSSIKLISDQSGDYCLEPSKHFTRTRKLPFETVVKTVIGMESKSLTNELINAFDARPDLPSASAFVQQRCKIKPEAFKSIFDRFTSQLIRDPSKNLRILAVDGSDIQIATNPNDPSSYHPGTDKQKPYNLLHLNALYDLEKQIYTDAIIDGKNNTNEHRALQDMVDNSTIQKALVIADRGYESFNSMAHIQEKGWFFLIRVKDGINGIKNGLDLPETDCFDLDISLKLTRKKTNSVKELFKDKNHYRSISSSQAFDYLPLKNRKSDPTVFYELNFRIVRFAISEDSYETIVTNLDNAVYTPHELKKLYARRWQIMLISA